MHDSSKWVWDEMGQEYVGYVIDLKLTSIDIIDQKMVHDITCGNQQQQK